MAEHGIYIVTYGVSPASLSAMQLVSATMLLLTIIITAGVFALMGKRGWWLIAMTAMLVPTAISFAASVALGGSYPIGSVREYLLGVAFPLAATYGLLGSSIGLLAGWLISRFTLRN